MSCITRSCNACLDHSFAREALSQLSRSPRGNLARHTEPLGTIRAQSRPSWPYAARQLSKPFGDSSAPLPSCLEPALEGPIMRRRDAHLVQTSSHATAVVHEEDRLMLTVSCPPYNRLKKIISCPKSRTLKGPRSALFQHLQG
ncbi:UNVERIFIED_CONTAM: hypothetical protein Sindi_2024200 [Sesamum indicum]